MVLVVYGGARSQGPLPVDVVSVIVLRLFIVILNQHPPDALTEVQRGGAGRQISQFLCFPSCFNDQVSLRFFHVAGAGVPSEEYQRLQARTAELNVGRGRHRT